MRFLKTCFILNHLEEVELRETLFDILMHFLSKIDTYEGMNKGNIIKNFC